MDGRTSTLRSTLRDGTAVLLRPVLPGDSQHLVRLLEDLSPRSRERRFLSCIKELSPSQLRYLTEIDFDRHMAWLALRSTPEGDRALGVSRYVCLPEEPKVAEAAVAVVDAYQGRGLGSLLLAALCRSAADHGIERFRANVATNNGPMRAMLRELGAKVHRSDGGTLEMELPVPRDLEQYPDTPTGRVLCDLASGLRPTRSSTLQGEPTAWRRLMGLAWC